MYAEPAAVAPPDPTPPAARRRGGHARRRSTATRTLATWFLALGIPLGAFLVFAVPAFQGLDEPNHFLRVFTLTSGVLVDPAVHSGAPTVEVDGLRARMSAAIIRPGLTSHGVVVDRCVAKYITREDHDAHLVGPMNLDLSFHTPPGCTSPAPGGHPNGVFEKIDNTAINSPVAYAPAVVAVGVLRLVGAPLPVIFYGGRLFSLAVYLALVALAIRVTPRGRSVLFVVGLLPMSLESAATYSADSMTLACSLLVVGLTIRCCVDEDAGWGRFGALAAVSCVLALCKEPYGLLALLVLLVPAAHLAGRPVLGRHPGRRAVLGAKVAVVAAAGLLAGAWYAIGVRGVSLTAQYPPGVVDQTAQIHTLLHHPFAAVDSIVHTWVNFGAEQYTVLGSVSELGFFRNQVGGAVAALPVAAVGLLTLFVASQHELGHLALRRPAAPGLLTADADRAATGPTARWHTAALWRTAALWLPAILALVIVLAIYAESYVRLTAPGSTSVDPTTGVPGRLFLPVLALPALPAILRTAGSERRIPTPWLIGAVLLMTGYTVIKVFTRFS